MSQRALGIALLAWVLVLGSFGLARAQDDRRAQAKEFFRAGEQSYTASQYGVAAQAFEEAYSILPVPAIAFSTAQAYRLQFFVDKDPQGLKRAIELYRKYVSEVKQGGRRQDAVTSLAELEPILLRLEAQGKQDGRDPVEAVKAEARTHIMITSSVPTAVVRIDDGEEQAVPLDKDVEAGEYRVRVSAAGYFPYDEVRTVNEGQFHLVPVQLSERPARVEIVGAEGASVSVDGRPVGVLPMPAPLELSAGSHFVTVGDRGRKNWSREITLVRGETATLRPSLAKTRQRQLSYVVAGSSLALMSVGGLYFLAAAGSNSDVQALERERQSSGLNAEQFGDYRLALDDRDSQRTRGVAFMAAGGVLAVGGALLYWIDMPSLEGRAARGAGPETRPAEEEDFAPMALVPSLSAESAGLALRGRF